MIPRQDTLDRSVLYWHEAGRGSLEEEVEASRPADRQAGGNAAQQLFSRIADTGREGGGYGLLRLAAAEQGVHSI